MDFFQTWLIFAAVMVAVSVSPGPAFVMCVRNSLLHGLRAGILTSLGLGFGLLVHASYTIYGVATLISESILIFNVIKWGGVAYLVYVGLKALRSNGYSLDTTALDKPTKSSRSAFMEGLVTSLFNPKAVLFFVAIFSQFLTPQMLFIHKAILALTCMASDVIWFSIVAAFLTRPKIRTRFLGYSKWIDRVCGGLFIALGVRLALTKAAS